MGVIRKGPTRVDRCINADRAMTLEEVGAVLGVTRERVRQIEKAALEKLRKRHMPELIEMRAMAIEMRRRSGHGCYGVIR